MRPIQDYAKSCIYVARHQLHVLDGDLFLARDYLERVASSNSEEVAMAADLLKKIKVAIQEKNQEVGNAHQDEVMLPTSTQGGTKTVDAVGGTEEAMATQ